MKTSPSGIEVAVKALVVRRGRVLLLKRGAAAVPSPGTWDTPGGRVEFGETLEAALRREIREELGAAATVRIQRVLNAWTLIKTPGTHLVGITFVCDLRGRMHLPPDAEHSEARWIPIAEAMKDRHLDASLRETLAAYARTSVRRTRR
jgi:8-oxo-dGTP diphosphatase